jgi:hypothetical protein
MRMTRPRRNASVLPFMSTHVLMIGRQSFRNEVVTWKCLRHPNIVAFMGTSNICPVCLVSEWMPEGTLFAFLERNPKEHRVRYVSTDILYLRNPFETTTPR